jgi:hypothetical protein
MLIDKEKKLSSASLRRLARTLVDLSEDRRKKVLDSLPVDDRQILAEMVKTLIDERPLLKG